MRRPTEAEYDDMSMRVMFQFLLRQLRIAHPECFHSHGGMIATQFDRWLRDSEVPDDAEQCWRILRGLLNRH